MSSSDSSAPPPQAGLPPAEAPRRTGRSRRRLYVVGGTVLGVVLVAAAVFLFMNSSPGAGPDSRVFTIGRGENLSGISRDLKSQGFIRSAPLLGAIGRLLGTQGVFKAGSYTIPRHATMFSIHNLLVRGSRTIEKVTIPEGWTSGKIARHLEALGICTAADFLAAIRSPALLARYGVTGGTMEGYLFPDTYFVPKPFPADSLVDVMAGTFFTNLAKIEPGWKEKGPKGMHDTVILASIVEREYQVDEEAPVIASVFNNRLARNIGLESCATLEYIITEIQQKAHPEYITLDDEKIDSPYNTYKWAGLPPGPISNPGRTALEAAFHPARTDYLYFVLMDPQAGRHFFSRNLNEHNQAKYLYLKKP